jgi:hypothetical protein
VEGGEVVVTISTALPGVDDDDDNDAAQKEKSTPSFETLVDEYQKFAGNADCFSKVKGNISSKKKVEHARNFKQKIIHGASNMKGMAGSG